MIQISIQKAPVILPARLKKYSSIGVLVDANTHKFCYGHLESKLPKHHVIEVPAGEEHKNLATCQFIWQSLTDKGFDRHSLLVLLGGGVIGDMGGFAAATYKRGIDFIIMPTTLLSQVDASIGGKLGVDFGPFKNHIGVFQQPVSTLIATDFLKTLPQRELRSGFAEVIKHCILSDRKMWKTIVKREVGQQNLLELVRHSVKFKSLVTRKDPREAGLRKILNFGHTFGHAIEGHFLTSGAGILHGEAIAAGMVIEATIAERKKLLKAADADSIRSYILSQFGKLNLPEAGKLVPLMAQDKKSKGNKILMALPKGIGKAVWDIEVSEAEILDAIDAYQSQT